MTTNQSNRKSLTGLIEGATASSNLDITGNVNMKGFKLFNLGLGTDLQDSTNKTQLDAVVSDITIIDNSISIIEISLNSIGNNDASFQAIDASLVFLDSSAVQFSLGIASNVVDIANNTTNIATNTSAIATANSNIATNTSNIATNTSNIATNTSAIATANSNISTNTSNIATNTSAIATANSNIATNTSAIATANGNISTNTSNIATNTSAIALNTAKVGITPSQASAIVANTAKVGITPSQASKITDNETAIDALVNLTTTQTSNIATNTSNIATNTSNISTNTSNITANTTAIAGCLKLDGTNNMTASLNAGTNKIINVVDPTSNQDAATKKYVDDNAGSSVWLEDGANIYRESGNVGIGGGASGRPHNRFEVQDGSLRVGGNMSSSFDFGFMADILGNILCYNADIIDTDTSCVKFRQQNSSSSNTGFTELFMGQVFRVASSARQASWGINVRNENGSYVGAGNASSMLCLVNEGGSVGINTTLNSTHYRLRVNGAAGGGGFWQNLSDNRLKYHEQDIVGALAILNKLKAQKYQKISESKNETGKWIPSDAEWDSVKNSVDSSGRRLYDWVEEIGFIAQDVRKINDLSFSVKGEEVDDEGNETPLVLAYDNIFCVAVQAIQELDAKRRDDNKKFIDLNKRIKILEDKMKNIEAETEKEYIL